MLNPNRAPSRIGFKNMKELGQFIDTHDTFQPSMQCCKPGCCARFRGPLCPQFCRSIIEFRLQLRARTVYLQQQPARAKPKLSATPRNFAEKFTVVSVQLRFGYAPNCLSLTPWHYRI